MSDEAEDLHPDALSIEDKQDRKFRWTRLKYRFVYFMARAGNATKAAELAGYKDMDYGRNLFTLPPIRRAVQAEVRRLVLAEQESEESVIARWARWANVDIGDYFAGGWQLRDVNELEEGQRKCIKRVKITETQWGRNIDLELHDAAKANNDLATMMGLLRTSAEGDSNPEGNAKTIREMLKEMDKVDVQEPPMEAGVDGAGKVTH